MSNERSMAATVPIAHRYEHDREHDWAALERFADLATRSGLTVSADEFIWMGAAEFHDGRTPPYWLPLNRTVWGSGSERERQMRNIDGRGSRRRRSRPEPCSSRGGGF